VDRGDHRDPVTATELPGRSPHPDRLRGDRRLLLLLSAACLVPAVLDAVQSYMQGALPGGYGRSWQGIVWSFIEWVILGSLIPLTYYLGRRFPLTRPIRTRNILIHLAGALVLCFGWAALGHVMRLVLGMYPDDANLRRELASWLLTSVPWSVFMYFTVLGCVHAIAFFAEARDREAQAARLAAQLAEARLGALRMQLNPHFLFNSLNAITVLVRDEDTRSAARMLERLGDVLRQVLRSDQANEVPLAEELHFLEQYLAIEQVRFSDRLRPTFIIDNELLDAAVPSFVIQPLVENALRHGLAKRSDAGRLEIGARREGDDLVLWVTDDGPGVANGSETREGVGLANTRERLTTLYGPSARLDLAPAPAGGTIATIRLPHRRLARPPSNA
jgi:two-component system, LytTR family, sensor kinase